MNDRAERELAGLDADRPLPGPLVARLESALLAEAAARGAGATATLFDKLDAPRPLPPATRASLERALVLRQDQGHRVLLAVAAAVLLVAGSIAALTFGPARESGSNLASGPPRSTPAAGVPPVLQAPAPSTVASPNTTPPAAAAAAAKRRPTPTTSTIVCGAPCTVTPYRAPSAATSGGGPAAAASAAEPPRPYVSSVDPSTGPTTGGTTVTVRGAGFTGATGVYFGSSAAAPTFTVVSDTEVRAVSPPSAQPQTVIVYVTFPGPTASTPTDGDSFTYTAP